jgi:DNA-binding NarL/FixJ family response regulator
MIKERCSLRRRQIIALLLQGCSNPEIAVELKIKERTVKEYFKNLFIQYNITGGFKRVKLATLLYRRQQQCQPPMAENTSTDPPI